MTGRRGLWSLGPACGALLTASLAAVFFLGWKVASFPFPPFDLFDWIARRIPGPLLTRGIDAMVAALRALHLGRTDSAAKMAEQGMALALFLLLGTLAGAALFAVARRRSGSALLPGMVAGTALGVLALLLRHGLGHPLGSAVVGSLWIVAMFEIWGACLALAFDTLHASTIQRTGRRRFLIRLGGATAAITVAGAAVGALIGRRDLPEGERWSSSNPLPNAGDAVEPAPGTRAELTPLEKHYRIDINTMVPRLDEDRWRLDVKGLVERPLALTLDELRAFPPVHQFVTLACISNPVGGDLIGTTRWTGVSFRDLLPLLNLRPEATHLQMRSADGFFETISLDTIRSDPRVMLAYAWDGLPLTQAHGFPLRVYIPDLYGMKQPKWIVSLEALDHEEDGYWVKRGWDRTARMKPTSVIDTVAVDAATPGLDGRPLVPIGGIAHAGARKIAAVEIQVDDGPWQQARLRTPMSETTWVIWRADLPFAPGEHRLTVRCVEGSGVVQSEVVAPPHPSGASGLQRKHVKVS